MHFGILCYIKTTFNKIVCLTKNNKNWQRAVSNKSVLIRRPAHGSKRSKFKKYAHSAFRQILINFRDPKKNTTGRSYGTLVSLNTYRYILEILNVLLKIPSTRNFLHVKSEMQVGHESVGQLGRFFSWGQKYDGSKFTGQSLKSYKKEAQEHGASILNPLQWVSKNRKTLPKLKNGHYSAFNARHILTPLRNQKSTFAKCCWSYFCKFGKLQKYLLQSLSFLVAHFWIKLWVMSQSPDGSHGSNISDPLASLCQITVSDGLQIIVVYLFNSLIPIFKRLLLSWSIK